MHEPPSRNGRPINSTICCSRAAIKDDDLRNEDEQRTSEASPADDEEEWYTRENLIAIATKAFTSSNLNTMRKAYRHRKLFVYDAGTNIVWRKMPIAEEKAKLLPPQRLSRDTSGKLFEMRRVLFTKDEKDLLWHAVHNGSGHRGRDASTHDLQQYWFPNMTDWIKQKVKRIRTHCCKVFAIIIMNVAAQIKSCHQCQITGKLEKKRQELHPIPVPSEVWTHIQLDLIVGLNTSKKGNSIVVTCMDMLSNWPEAVGIPDQTAASVAKVLAELVLRFGPPAVIQTDRGREFFNKVLTAMARDFNIGICTWTHSAPFTTDRDACTQTCAEVPPIGHRRMAKLKDGTKHSKTRFGNTCLTERIGKITWTQSSGATGPLHKPRQSSRRIS